MSAATDGQPLTIDPQAFADAMARRPCAVDHTLVGHPLLTLDAIADLADRFEGRVERHRADLPVVMPGGAPELDGPPSETVRGIESNGCWMVFWYLESVPEYKDLLDQCLDQVETYLPPEVGRAVRRECFLFLSAPNAVTPVHFDPEHNFLLQIKGRKDMHVTSFGSELEQLGELERYFDGGDRNLGTMPAGDETFVLQPGNGVYVPSFWPHWVQNGPEASISLSITFRTRESQRAERVHLFNAGLRRLKLSPRPPGTSMAGDRAKESAWLAVRAPMRAARGARKALQKGGDATTSG